MDRGSNVRARRMVRGIACGAVLISMITVAPVAVAGTTAKLTGSVYRDTDRDGTRDAAETGFRRVRVLLFDEAGTFVDSRVTDRRGRYAFAGLLLGSYRVEVTDPAWWALRDDWVPTTTGTLRPRLFVDLSTSAVADFGWRPILRSTTLGSPITSVTGPNGLRVESYDDVVSAQELSAALMAGSVGEEAGTVIVRFDYGAGSATVASVIGTPGAYTQYQATSYVDYESWLDQGDVILSHEYGHAWSMYYAYLVQQDATLGSYLQARGLAGDPRVGSSYAWDTKEMIAEDYRQLLGSPTARLAPQTNRDIPSAAEVPGLAAFLAGGFTQPPA